MIYAFFLLYRLILIPIAVLLLPFALPFSRKLREGLKLRMKARGVRFPLSERPFWIHASSGEFEYAKPVIRELKSRFPHIPILVTYFSPSYKDQIARFAGVDRFEPLPLDLPGAIHSFLNFHKPRALLIARTDLWPELLWQTSQRKIPSLLFSHTRRATPSLFHFYFRVMYSLLSEIFVVAQEDLNEVSKTTQTPTLATGDTRYDQVNYRLHDPQRLPGTVERAIAGGLATGEFLLLAGSTWEEDEDQLFSAYKEISPFPIRMMLVPHETNDEHLEAIKAKAEHFGVSLRFANQDKFDTSKNTPPVTIVDHKGVLADLYSLADLAFIGGSFKRKVHSVMEALGAGKIVAVGPHYTNNREAVQFSRIEVGSGLFAVNMVQNAKELETLIIKVSGLTPEERSQIEAKIRTEFMDRLGATAKVIDWCDFHLETSFTQNIPNA